VRVRHPTMRLLTYAHKLSTSFPEKVLLQKVLLEKVPLPRLSNGDGRYLSLAVLTHFRVLILQNSPRWVSEYASWLKIGILNSISPSSLDLGWSK
jgi:hypothetical protein